MQSPARPQCSVYVQFTNPDLLPVAGGCEEVARHLLFIFHSQARIVGDMQGYSKSTSGFHKWTVYPSSKNDSKNRKITQAADFLQCMETVPGEDLQKGLPRCNQNMLPFIIPYSTKLEGL